MYTCIDYELRKFLDISIIEYHILGIVFFWSKQNKEWCYASRETMAEMLGISRGTIISSINRLTERGFLIKHPDTKHLRTSEHFEILNDITNKEGIHKIDSTKFEQVVQKNAVQKLNPMSTKIEPDAVQNLNSGGTKFEPNNKYYNNTYNNTNKEKEIFDVFRKQYKDLIGGKVLGLDTEFDNFKQYPKWKEVLPNLLNAIQKEKQHRDKLLKEKKFVPEPKNLKYWIKEKRWETEYPEIKSQAQLEAERWEEHRKRAEEAEARY